MQSSANREQVLSTVESSVVAVKAWCSTRQSGLELGMDLLEPGL